MSLDPFFDRLKQSLQKAPPKNFDAAGAQLREASVLAPVFLRGGAPWTLVTKRPENLRKHPGQISFPGGGREAHDITPLHTALRETEEELGIPRAQVDVLGLLGAMPVISGYYVTPFVGAVPDGLVLKPSAQEIAQVLEVPLLELRNEQREFFGSLRDSWVWGSGEHAIWGATWRMLCELLPHVQAASK